MARVVIVVFDGLNEELVTPELMPNLRAFAGAGARLLNHRPVFPSVTRLNAASMVTGCFPGAHGIAANLALIPEHDPLAPMDVLEPQLSELRRRTGRTLLVPTLSDLLAQHGLEYIAAGVGTSGQAFMHHPNGEDAALGATIHTDYALPRSLFDEMIERFGPWPDAARPNNARVERLTTLFTEYVLAERDPAVALMWYSEPDGSQHGLGLASPEVYEAVRHADAQFGRLLDWLEAEGRLGDTNVIVTCDHGQSTILEAVPLAEELAAAGFAAAREPGGVIVAGNGGSALFYIDGHDAAVADRLAAWLMAQPWCGPILASARVGDIDGTLPASLVGVDGERSPDLLMSFGWTNDANEFGRAGSVFSSGGVPGHGTHGSMSPWEFRTFTVASGPAFRSNASIEVATGHPDLAPTILHVLGLPVPPHMQGRVMAEAIEGALLAQRPPADPRPAPTVELREANREIGGVTYRQRLEIAALPGGPGHLVSATATRVSISRSLPARS